MDPRLPPLVVCGFVAVAAAARVGYGVGRRMMVPTNPAMATSSDGISSPSDTLMMKDAEDSQRSLSWEPQLSDKKRKRSQDDIGDDDDAASAVSDSDGENGSHTSPKSLSSPTPPPDTPPPSSSGYPFNLGFIYPSRKKRRTLDQEELAELVAVDLDAKVGSDEHGQRIHEGWVLVGSEKERALQLVSEMTATPPPQTPEIPTETVPEASVTPALEAQTTTNTTLMTPLTQPDDSQLPSSSTAPVTDNARDLTGPNDGTNANDQQQGLVAPVPLFSSKSPARFPHSRTLGGTSGGFASFAGPTSFGFASKKSKQEQEGGGGSWLSASTSSTGIEGQFGQQQQQPQSHAIGRYSEAGASESPRLGVSLPAVKDEDKDGSGRTAETVLTTLYNVKLYVKRSSRESFNTSPIISRLKLIRDEGDVGLRILIRREPLLQPVLNVRLPLVDSTTVNTTTLRWDKSDGGIFRIVTLENEGDVAIYAVRPNKKDRVAGFEEMVDVLRDEKVKVDVV